MKLWMLLKIEGSVLMYMVPPLGPTYIGESTKAYGLKMRCLYGEHVGEHIVNLGNLKGTPWEHIRKLKKKKKSKAPWALLLVERKINPPLPPSLHQIQLEKKKTSPLTSQP